MPFRLLRASELDATAREVQRRILKRAVPRRGGALLHTVCQQRTNNRERRHPLFCSAASRE
jgi:hypothetical protein